MITTKSIDIDNVIITAEDIKSLAAAVESAILAAPEPSSKPVYWYYLKGIDGTEWRSESQDILGPSGPLTSDKILQVRLQATTGTVDDTAEFAITVKLAYSNYWGGSDVVISGPSQDWVYATYQRFEEHLKRFEPQATIGTRYRQLTVASFFIGAALSLTLLISIILWNGVIPWLGAEEARGEFWAFTLLVGMVVSLIVAFLSGAFSKVLRETYPRLEIRTGPIHGQVTIRNRRIIKWFIGLVVLPVLTSIIASLVWALFD